MRNMKKAICIVAALSVLAANAAVVRKLPVVSVVENETISTDSLKATAVRSRIVTQVTYSTAQIGELDRIFGYYGMTPHPIPAAGN